MAETHGWGTPNDAYRAPTGTPLPSRRSMRDTRTASPDTRTLHRPEHAGRRTTAPARPPVSTSTPVAPKRRAKSRVAFSAVVMTLAAGLVATLALPSYAFDPSHGQRGSVQAQGRLTTSGGDQELPQVGGRRAEREDHPRRRHRHHRGRAEARRARQGLLRLRRPHRRPARRRGRAYPAALRSRPLRRPRHRPAVPGRALRLRRRRPERLRLLRLHHVRVREVRRLPAALRAPAGRASAPRSPRPRRSPATSSSSTTTRTTASTPATA